MRPQVRQRDMKPDQPRLFLLLLGSLLAMLLGLVGLTLILAQTSSTLEHIYQVIVDDAAPSVLELEAASVKLTSMEGLLRDRTRASPHSAELLDAEIRSGRRELADIISGYTRLPPDPGEAEARARIREASDHLGRVIDRIQRESPENADELARVLDTRVAELNAALFAAASINAATLTRASSKLLMVRRSVLPSIVVLELLCLAAAAVTLAAAYRLVQGAAASAAESRQKLERRMAELDLFSARVAHDLLSPLLSVSLALGVAERSLVAPEQQRARAMMGRAVNALQGVRQMVNDLLDFARAGATPPPNARADAPAVLRDIAEDFAPIAAEACVELRTEAGSRRLVRCSAGVLRSILANLVQNAIRYAGGGERSVSVRSTDEGDDVRFEVEDTGLGIAQEDQQSIFEPYVRRSDAGAGLGLGLATVKRLAEGHGGRVGVESAPGQGARFWVMLPAVA